MSTGRSTGNTLLALAALGTTGATFAVGLSLPATVEQGDTAKLIAIHPPIAWVAYLAFGVTALTSALYLWPKWRSRLWDLVAGASAEIGVVFTRLTLVLGAIWGRGTWGVWWTWDARLTTTALLFLLFCGYLALRRVPGSVEARAKRSAVAALVAAVDIPIVHFSVEWWRTLHQGRTLLRPDASSQLSGGSYGQAMLLGFVAMTLVYLWLVIERTRVEELEEQLEEDVLGEAMAERAAERALVTGDA